MFISTSVVSYFLAQRYGITACSLRRKSVDITQIHIYDGKKNYDSGILICDCDKYEYKGEDKGKVLGVLCGEGECSNDITAENGDYIYIRKNVDVNDDVYRIAEYLFDVSGLLFNWECDLKDGVIQNSSPSEMMELCERFCGKCILIDNNYTVIYKSQFAENWDSKRILNDAEFNSGNERHDAYTYRSPDSREKYLCVNLFNDSQYMARILVAIGEGNAEIAESFLVHYAPYGEKMYIQFAGEARALHQNDSMHTVLRDLVMNGEKINTMRSAEILNEFGWDQQHIFSIVKIKLMEDVHDRKQKTLFVCGQLERD